MLTVLPNYFNVTVFCIQVVSSAIVDKYIGESARLIREMFNYARDHQPCIIFMDEIDAIGLFIQFLNVKLKPTFIFIFPSGKKHFC